MYRDLISMLMSKYLMDASNIAVVRQVCVCVCVCVFVYVCVSRRHLNVDEQIPDVHVEDCCRDAGVCVCL